MLCRQCVGFWNLAVWTSIWVGVVLVCVSVTKLFTQRTEWRKGNPYRTLARCTTNSLYETGARSDRGIGHQSRAGGLLQGPLGDVHHQQHGHALQGIRKPAVVVFSRADSRRSTRRFPCQLL